MVSNPGGELSSFFDQTFSKKVCLEGSYHTIRPRPHLFKNIGANIDKNVCNAFFSSFGVKHFSSLEKEEKGLSGTAEIFTCKVK